MTTKFLDALNLSIRSVPLPATFRELAQAANDAVGGETDLALDWVSSELNCLLAALRVRDPETAAHSQRVARIALLLAEQMDCDQRTRRMVYLGGLLHDIGKLGIDDAVLRNESGLTADQLVRARCHVELGCRLVQGLEPLAQLAPIVLYHHEAWDGSGYPFGLRGTQIPLGARICSVADSFDAMSSDRPYRKALPRDKVDAELTSGAGKQWDPAVVDAYCRIRDALQSFRAKSATVTTTVRVPEMHARAIRGQSHRS